MMSVFNETCDKPESVKQLMLRELE